MRVFILISVYMVTFALQTARATLLEIPYSGGKKAGTVVVTKVSNVQMSPDTLKIGLAVIRFSLKSDILLAVCGAKPTIVAQFLGGFASVSQTRDTSANWNTYTTWPVFDSLVRIDSLNILKNGMPDPEWRAPGFDLFSEGPGRSCTGTEYFLAPRWNRVVFMQMGSGVVYRLKVSFQAQNGTTENPTSMIYNSYLNSITVHYVLNANSTDVSGAPVSIRAQRVSRVSMGAADWRRMDLYSPLGVKIHRETGRFEALIPVRR